MSNCLICNQPGSGEKTPATESWFEERNRGMDMVGYGGGAWTHSVCLRKSLDELKILKERIAKIEKTAAEVAVSIKTTK